MMPREVIDSLKKEAEIKVNDCEVIRALALCRFSTIFPREVKLNNCIYSSKSNFRLANLKYFKDNGNFLSGS